MIEIFLRMFFSLITLLIIFIVSFINNIKFLLRYHFFDINKIISNFLLILLFSLRNYRINPLYLLLYIFSLIAFHKLIKNKNFIFKVLFPFSIFQIFSLFIYRMYVVFYLSLFSYNLLFY